MPSDALAESFTPQLLRQLESLRIKSRKAFLGARQGGHLSLKRGHGIEFSDYRNYEPGDNPRDIDWGVYARSDRVYVKKFQEEQSISALIFVDSTSSMDLPEGERKWQTSKEIALALAYILLLQQDSVTLATSAGKALPPCYGPKGFYHLARALSQVQFSREDTLYRAVKQAVSRIRFPGLAIVISDFMVKFEDIDRTFTTLRAKNLDITAIQVLSPGDFDPAPGIDYALILDSETDEQIEVSLDPTSREQYRQNITLHNQRLRDYLVERQIRYCSVMSDQSIAEFAANILPSTGLLA